MRNTAPEPDLVLITEDTPRWRTYMFGAFATGWAAAGFAGVMWLLADRLTDRTSSQKIFSAVDTGVHAAAHLSPATVTVAAAVGVCAALAAGVGYRTVSHTVWSGIAGAAVIVLAVAMIALGRAAAVAATTGSAASLTTAMLGAVVAAAIVLACTALRRRLPEHPATDSDDDVGDDELGVADGAAS